MWCLHQMVITQLLCCKRGFPGCTAVKEPACHCRREKRRRFDPWVEKMPWRRAWHSIPAFLPGGSRGQRSLVRQQPTGSQSRTCPKRLSTHARMHIVSLGQTTVSFSSKYSSLCLLHRVPMFASEYLDFASLGRFIFPSLAVKFWISRSSASHFLSHTPPQSFFFF